jgi:hypothetical protein
MVGLEGACEEAPRTARRAISTVNYLERIHPKFIRLKSLVLNGFSSLDHPRIDLSTACKSQELELAEG